MAVIQIVTTTGRRQLSAEVVGHFGVHHQGYRWAITHIPTGAGLPFAFDGPEDAIRCAGELARQWDWSTPNLRELYSAIPASDVLSVVHLCGGERINAPRVGEHTVIGFSTH
jgi:hypothetical protein